MDLYQSLLRPILFSGLRADPEWLHRQTIQVLSALTTEITDDTHPLHRPARWIEQQIAHACQGSADRLTQSLWGLSFPNPVGLAAGFDKNGTAAALWPSFGFGFAELGTVTRHAQPGNPAPRLFRLLADRAVLNRMGFNNAGAEAMAARLRATGGDRPHPIPIGINLGKSKITPLEAAAADYVYSFRCLQGLGDYFVVNVSSPNTPGLRSLQATEQLEPILTALQSENTTAKPLLVKIAPDLAEADLRDVIHLATRCQLAGIIATNTTISREGLKTQRLAATGQSLQAEAGGISGPPLRSRSTEVIRLIWRETQGQMPIIGVGGIFTAADAWEKITAGATLVQAYTGWVYEGPLMMRRIVLGLQEQLDRHHLPTIAAAVGWEHRQVGTVAPHAPQTNPQTKES